MFFDLKIIHFVINSKLGIYYFLYLIMFLCFDNEIRVLGCFFV